MPNFETIYVDTTVVACNGGEEGHPKVYLNLAGHGEVECPYCSRLYVMRKPAGGHGAGAAPTHS